MDSSNAYIYGGGTAPAEQVNLSTGASDYLAADSLGSVRGIVSSSGSLTASTSYDAWGNPQSPGGLISYTPFGYAGGYTDPTGLIYLINRYYDPSTGQFLSVDPAVGQTGQPYAYAGGNPVSATDPMGLWLFGMPSNQSGDGPTPEFNFQLWLEPLLGVPRKAQAQYGVEFGFVNFRRRNIDIYQKTFGWLNELKVGRQSYAQGPDTGTSIGSEIKRDKYILANNIPGQGPPGQIACHPTPSKCQTFQANGGTWWFRYRTGHACQESITIVPCPSANLMRHIALTDSQGPAMNIMFVFHTSRNQRNYARIYRNARVELRKAFQSNNCPIQAIDNIGLQPRWKFPNVAGC
jgi:RHS repeat-associated protein